MTWHSVAKSNTYLINSKSISYVLSLFSFSLNNPFSFQIRIMYYVLLANSLIAIGKLNKKEKIYKREKIKIQGIWAFLIHRLNQIPTSYTEPLAMVYLALFNQ